MTSLSNSSTGFKLPRPRTVAVIGAGPAGLTAAKQAIALGHTVTVFEQHDGLGGIWHPEGGGAYPSVRMQTSRSAFHYSDHPPAPGEGGEFLTLREMADYFRSYADRFEVLDECRLAARAPVPDVIGPDDRRAARDQCLGHVLVTADVLPVAVHEHDQPGGILGRPPAHMHPPDRRRVIAHGQDRRALGDADGCWELARRGTVALVGRPLGARAW